MFTSLTSLKRWSGLLLTFLLIGLSVAGPAGASPDDQAGSKLSPRGQELLAEARARGEKTVRLLIASKDGANTTVAGGVAGPGGTVEFREDGIDYLRALVAIDRVEAVASLAEVEAVDVDEVIPLEDPRPDAAQGVTPQPPPGAATPRNNPYLPIGDTGAAQFTVANPSWDGRGVTVGIIDTGIDLHHPSLQTTSTGERKIVDWLTYTHPFTNDDPTWVNMKDQVSGSTFSYSYTGSRVVSVPPPDGSPPGTPPTKKFEAFAATTTFTAPAAGAYRIGIFNEHDPRLGGEVGNDVNRDGNPVGSSGVFAVLWDTATNNVYVDANQNSSFADEPAMTDYRARYDVGTFGTDDPATALREAMPFVVQTDGRNKVVNIGIVSGAHGSHVAGIVAGHQLFGGQMSGAAPGAKLISVRVCLFIAGCTAHALLEGMIFAANQANVDVINMSIGGLPALNDGHNARAILYSRLVEEFKVPLFLSAGNSGPGVNTVGDPSVASKVMSVGAYITKATWQRNYGSDSAYVDNLHPFSSRGPREDGGFKPNIVAPGAAISTIPTWQPGGPVAGTYPLPPGYAMFNGTSMAAPQAAGAAALLVSAAKQAGVQYQPAQVRQALSSSARYLDRYQAYEQGDGLIDVGAAWDLLKTNIATVDISSSVPVSTALSDFLATPGYGQGIHDREGVAVGQSYTRRYTFTRTSGDGGTKTYNLSWVGNDGTFSAASPSIALPKNVPVTLDVTVTPATAGAHAAILNLDDPRTVGVDYQTMNVVIAAERFSAASNYSITKTGTIGRNQALRYFFSVPPGTPAFKVDFAGPSSAAGTGQARFLRFHPYGVGIDSNASTACYSPPVATGCNPGSRAVSNPQAGVWEVTVEARRTSDVAEAPFTLTASILGASVSPNPDVIPAATIGTPVARSYTLTNLFGPFTGRAVGTTLGSARRGVFSIADEARQEYPVVVTAGSTSLRATIGGSSDPAADLDLYVYDCTSGSCKLAGQSADGDSEESVTIANPAAGNWKVVIHGYAVPAGTTTYNYVDVFTNSAFGSISVTDADAPRATGASWTVPATVTANAAPAEGRVLLGNVQVRTDTNVLVGSGDVVIEKVSP